MALNKDYLHKSLFLNGTPNSEKVNQFVNDRKSEDITIITMYRFSLVAIDSFEIVIAYL